MSQLSDFVVCSTSIYIWSSEIYVLGLEHNCEVEIQDVNSSDRITTILESHFHHLHHIKATSTFILRYNALIQTLQRSPNHE